MKLIIEPSIDIFPGPVTHISKHAFIIDYIVRLKIYIVICIEHWLLIDQITNEVHVDTKIVFPIDLPIISH